MQQPPKSIPRFVPTLTEVVHIPQPSAPAGGPQPVVNPDDIVDKLMYRLDGPLQVAIGNVLSSLAVDHFKKLEPLLRDEIDRVVRRAVDDALAAELDATNPRP